MTRNADENDAHALIRILLANAQRLVLVQYKVHSERKHDDRIQ